MSDIQNPMPNSNSRNENLRSILVVAYERVNHLSTVNQTNTTIFGAILIGLFAIFWQDLFILAMISVPLIMIWRIYARYIDNDIIRQYGKIISCEKDLLMPEKVSLMNALIEGFPHYRKNEYSDLSEEEKFDQFIYLIKTKQISHRQHDYFDLIAVIGIFFYLIALKNQLKIENFVQDLGFNFFLFIFFIAIWWLIENLFVRRTPPPVRNLKMSSHDKAVMYSQLIVYTIGLVIGFAAIFLVICSMLFFDWMLIYGITKSTDILYESIFLLPLIVVLGFLYSAKKIPILTLELIQKTQQSNANVPHHAIIIAHKTKPNKDGSFDADDYFDGIDILIKKFCKVNPKINFRIYDVSSKEEVIPIFLNDYATHLWIFGHGKRHQLALYQESLNYYDIKNCPKKEFIGQYHCNGLFWRSSVDYNNPINYDVTWWLRWGPLIRNSVRKKMCELGI
jgi:hypothetical protein